MKKGIAIVAALGFVAGVTAYFMCKHINEELELGLNMEPEDFDTPDMHNGCECDGECDGRCLGNCHCSKDPAVPEKADS